MEIEANSSEGEGKLDAYRGSQEVCLSARKAIKMISLSKKKNLIRAM